MEVIKKDLKDIVEDLEEIKEAVSKNTENIVGNKEQIDKNTGTLEILHTINDSNRKFYKIWKITFFTSLILLIISVGFNIFLLIKLLCR